MQEHITHRYLHIIQHHSTPTNWSKSRDSVLSYHWVLSSRLCTLQKHHVGSGWQVCDHSPLLSQQQPQRQVSKAIAQSHAKERLGELIPSLLPPPQEKVSEPNRSSHFQSQDPRGPGSADSTRLRFLQMQHCLCSLLWSHLLADTKITLPAQLSPSPTNYCNGLRHQIRASKLTGR